MGDLLPSVGSVGVGVGARGALMVMGTGAREGGWVELMRCGVVAGGGVVGVVFFERDFLVEFVPSGVMERVPVLRRFANRR